MMAAALPPAFTTSQKNAFFKNGPQMGLSAAVRAQLATEGLTAVAHFDDFCEDQLELAFKNLRTAIPGVPAVLDAGGAVQVPAVVPIAPRLISACCALRLKVALIVFHYYNDIGCTPMAANMNNTLVLEDFHVE